MRTGERDGGWGNDGRSRRTLTDGERHEGDGMTDGAVPPLWRRQVPSLRSHATREWDETKEWYREATEGDAPLAMAMVTVVVVVVLCGGQK